MHNGIWKTLLGVTLAASLLLAPVGARAGTLSFRTPAVSGDTSSDGAVITVALFATACVVLVLLGLKADYENVFTRAGASPQNRTAADPDPQTMAEIRRHLDSSDVAGGGTSGDEIGVALAWHVRF
jgi:hypothetical protein